MLFRITLCDLAICQEIFDSGKCGRVDTVMSKFREESLAWHLVESFTQVQRNNINLVFRIQIRGEISLIVLISCDSQDLFSLKPCC